MGFLTSRTAFQAGKQHVGGISSPGFALLSGRPAFGLVGLAVSTKTEKPNRVFCLISVMVRDGRIWNRSGESVQSLINLVLLVDWNGLQSDGTTRVALWWLPIGEVAATSLLISKLLISGTSKCFRNKPYFVCRMSLSICQPTWSNPICRWHH